MSKGEKQSAGQTAYNVFMAVLGLCGFFGITVAPSVFDLSNPVIAGCVIAVALACGFAIGWWGHGRKVDSEAKAAAAVEKARQDSANERLRLSQKAKEEDEARKTEESRIEFVKGLEFKSKQYLWRLYSRGFVDMPNDLREGFDRTCGFPDWVVYEPVSREDDRPELLECAKGSLSDDVGSLAD